MLHDESRHRLARRDEVPASQDLLCVRRESSVSSRRSSRLGSSKGRGRHTLDVCARRGRVSTLRPVRREHRRELEGDVPLACTCSSATAYSRHSLSGASTEYGGGSAIAAPSRGRSCTAPASEKVARNGSERREGESERSERGASARRTAPRRVRERARKPLSASDARPPRDRDSEMKAAAARRCSPKRRARPQSRGEVLLERLERSSGSTPTERLVNALHALPVALGDDVKKTALNVQVVLAPTADLDLVESSARAR